MTIMHRWARVNRRGVPQGYSPSDLLAKLYLNAVDLTLRNEGFVHRRWVDDFRIFCDSEAGARKALVVLTEALGRRGLVLQSAKTEILDAAEARIRFGEVEALLQPLYAELIQRLIESEAIDGPYLPPWELDEVLAEVQSDEPIALIRAAYEQYFITSSNPFRKTLFRFLLRRLAAANDRTYLSHILSFLRDHPEETDIIAAYAAGVQAVRSFEERFMDLWSSGIVPYPYQLYQIFRWRLRQTEEISEELLDLARQQALAGSPVWYVRATARAVIGRWGSAADLERLEHAYPDARSANEAAEIICCLTRMESGRRNAFLGRVAGDGDLQSRAVRAVRENRIRWDAA